MGMIWLIIKIILWIILICIGLLICLCTLILVAPIRYEAYLEKYDQLNYDVKVKYLGGVKGHFYLQDGIKFHEFKIFGKVLYSEKEKESTVEETPVTSSMQATPRNFSTTQDQAKEIVNHKEIGKQQPTLEAEQISSKTGIPVKEKVKSTENEVYSNKSMVRQLVSAPYFYGLLKGSCKLVKELVTYIGPREWSFELIVGKEEPADTGELMAKLIMLYPWYYKHGIIKGDYEAAGMWGGFLAEGKFCLGGILKRIIRFLWYKPIRESIKLILRLRKEEEHGE